ncbi:MAG: hypothetical protein M1828_000945 [Chrysothrix sp. TS-e1954]|nr:MAG: hypothetical protein M1828_000945 [Chrysothrix sp. TS-e1954]
MADEDVEDAIREYAALTGGIFWLSHDEGEDMNDEASGIEIVLYHDDIPEIRNGIQSNF